MKLFKKPVYENGRIRVARYYKSNGKFDQYRPQINPNFSKINSDNSQYLFIHDEYKWCELRQLRLFFRLVKRKITLIITWAKRHNAIILLLLTTIMLIFGILTWLK